MSAGQKRTTVELGWWTDRGRSLPVYSVGFAILFLAIAGRTGQFQPIHRALFAVFGAGFAYLALVRFTNKTNLVLGEENLTMQHGPLPWPGQRMMSVADIRDVRVDSASNRLQVRTLAGDEVALLDDVKRSSVDRLNRELAEMMAVDPSTGEDSDPPAARTLHDES